MTKTKLTKTGEPVMGTTIELHITPYDPEKEPWWEAATVVGKGWSNSVPRRLILVVVEYEDGLRESLYDWEDVTWRPTRSDGEA